MNLRTLKKREKRAMRTLVRKHGFNRDDFTPSDGNESIYAPKDMHPRYVRHGFLERLLPCTPVVWCQVSYEYNEYDAFLPSEILRDVETDWDALAREMREAANEE